MRLPPLLSSPQGQHEQSGERGCASEPSDRQPHDDHTGQSQCDDTRPTNPQDNMRAGQQHDDGTGQAQDGAAAQAQGGDTGAVNVRYKGVSWVKHISKWQARTRTASGQTYLGCFDCAEDAARAYDAATYLLRGR